MFWNRLFNVGGCNCSIKQNCAVALVDRGGGGEKAKRKPAPFASLLCRIARITCVALLHVTCDNTLLTKKWPRSGNAYVAHSASPKTQEFFA